MHLFVTGGRDEIHSKKNIIDNKQPKILRTHYYFKLPSHCRALFHHSYKNKNTPMENRGHCNAEQVTALQVSCILTCPGSERHADDMTLFCN